MKTIKNSLFIILSLFTLSFMTTSCESVPPGHKGVEVEWGGKTNLKKTYDEGMHTGTQWLMDDLVAVDCRIQTVTYDFEFNDSENMKTGVEISIDYRNDPDQVITQFVKITDKEAKIKSSMQDAGKKVVPDYSASDLNISKREEAIETLTELISADFKNYYLILEKVRITDVDLPASIVQAAEDNAKQLEANKLAEKKEAYEKSQGAARVAKAKADFTAAEYDAKTKKILSQPAMLKYKQLEVEELMWKGFEKHGKSPYGSNNVFGEGVLNIKGFN